MECLICNNSISSLSSVKITNGKICKTCASKLPSLFIESSKYSNAETFQHVINRTKENYDKFSATASYGELHIDEMHGLFSIAKSLTAEGKPKNGMNVFSIYDLSEVGLYCKTPRKDHNSVLVDVEFSCVLEDLGIQIKHIVKKSITCVTKRIDAEHVRWEEPNDLCMFRTLFNQMLSGMHEKINKLLYGKTVHDFEIEKARALFMLHENYDLDELNTNFKKMITVWQPKEAEETTEYIILKNAYNLLAAELEYIEKKARFGY